VNILVNLFEKEKYQWNYVHFKIHIAQNARQKNLVVHDLKNSELSALENLNFYSYKP